MNVIDKIEKQQCKESVADFKVGDTVTVSTKIVEGTTERIQKFTGVVIARKNSGIRETFTVRRVSFGYGVEKIFIPYMKEYLEREVPSIRILSCDQGMPYNET